MSIFSLIYKALTAISFLEQDKKWESLVMLYDRNILCRDTIIVIVNYGVLKYNIAI